MNETNAPTVKETQSKLLTNPHVVNKLIDLLVGDWQPTSDEQEFLVTHLSECSDCRIAFSTLLAIRDGYEAKQDYPESFIQNFSKRFIALHDQIESRRLERMSAYIDTIVEEGKEKADEQFPVFAEYMKKSFDFQSTVANILGFLSMTAKNDQHA